MNTGEKEFQERRRNGIGGSDAGVIAGYNKYKTLYTLWAEKLGRVSSFEGNRATCFGQDMEQYIRKACMDTGIGGYYDDAVRVLGADFSIKEHAEMITSKEHSFMLAHIDGIISVEGKGDGILEIKTANSMQKKKWEDEEVPDAYYAQAQHYMAVTGMQFAFIACLIDNTIIFRLVPRRDDFIKSLIEREAKFWNNVKTNTPPATDASDEPIIKEAITSGEGELEINDDSLDQKARQLNDIKERKSALEKEEKTLKADILSKYSGVQANKVILNTGSFIVTVSSSDRNSLNTTLLKKEKPDVYTQYSTSNRVSQIRIKEVK